jgi:hypothetical protein
MLVVLDLSASRCIKHGVQFCNCPEGFASIKEMHPEDTFCFADEVSKQSFIDFMDFMEAMGWTLDEYYAEKNHLDDENDEPLPDPIHDEVEFINAFCDDDYDYWLECSQDAMWIKNNC